MNSIKFAKMSGAGNDFVIIDNRDGQLVGLDAKLIRKWCTRRLAIGADGLMLLNKSDQADFEMAYYNADGSGAAMCGNGGRCIARFAVLIGLAQPSQLMSFEAPSGRYQAIVEGNQVDLTMIPPKGIDKDVSVAIDQEQLVVDVVDTGVPHAVQFVGDVEEIVIGTLGPAIRYHQIFKPQGVNVNFAQIIDKHFIKIRTYERGVEGETLACGTGAAAAALIGASKGLLVSPVVAQTRSKVLLEMKFELDQDQIKSLHQKGEARLIYWGSIDPEAEQFEEIDG